MTSSVSALESLYDQSEIDEYPSLSAWAKSTEGKNKSFGCAPAAWTYVSDIVEPNATNLISCLGTGPVDVEVKSILQDRQNPCFKIAMMYGLYQIMVTDPKTFETPTWNLSQPLVQGVYSGDQAMAGEDIISRIETSTGPSIVHVNGYDYDHIWLVTGMEEGKFMVFPNKIFDFRNGDFGKNFYGFDPQMNFVNLRAFDGSPVPTPDDLYGANTGFCFLSSVMPALQ